MSQRTCLLSLVVAVCVGFGAGLDLYPWGKFDFEEHAADVLDRLRENEQLLVWDSTLSKSLLSPQAERLALRNIEGNTFELSAAAVATAPLDLEDSNKELARFDFQIFANELSGACAMLIDGYWSYEFCFG